MKKLCVLFALLLSGCNPTYPEGAVKGALGARGVTSAITEQAGGICGHTAHAVVWRAERRGGLACVTDGVVTFLSSDLGPSGRQPAA